MGISLLIFIVLLFTVGLALYLDRDKVLSRLRSPKSTNRSKYLELIAALSVLDEIFDGKLSLGRNGINVDYGFMHHQFQILELVSTGKLSIFGGSFTSDIMKIVNNAEFNLVDVENASRYIKIEINKLKKLVDN